MVQLKDGSFAIPSDTLSQRIWLVEQVLIGRMLALQRVQEVLAGSDMDVEHEITTLGAAVKELEAIRRDVPDGVYRGGRRLDTDPLVALRLILEREA